MAWIESHQELAEHPKLFHLASLVGLTPDACIGRLHRLWWWCLKFADDGDLSRYQSVQIPAIETDEFRAHLRTSKWLDGDLIHDWIDYAGRFLINRYSTSNVEKLKTIWLKYGYKYGKCKGKFSKQKVSRKRVESEQEANIPNLTIPNLTNLTKPKEMPACGFEEFWKAYPKKRAKEDARKAWVKMAKLRPPLGDILRSIERVKQSHDWIKDNGQFIPHPATWLNSAQWDDEQVELPPPKPQLVGGKAYQTYEPSVGKDGVPMPEDFMAKIGTRMQVAHRLPRSCPPDPSNDDARSFDTPETST